jgi:anti-sigma factor RsiW
MPCNEFESWLLDYAGLEPERRRAVDIHLAVCPECRLHFEALAEADAALSLRFPARRAPAGFETAVLGRIERQLPLRKPPLLPEILDFVGWTAVVATAAGLLYRLSPWLATGT